MIGGETELSDRIELALEEAKESAEKEIIGATHIERNSDGTYTMVTRQGEYLLAHKLYQMPQELERALPFDIEELTKPKEPAYKRFFKYLFALIH